MSVGAIGNTKPNYSPQKTDNVAQLEKQMQTLTKQMQEIKGNDKLDPEKKQNLIQNIEKKIAQIKNKIAQMKQNSTNGHQKQLENKEQDLRKKTLISNNVIDKYA